MPVRSCLRFTSHFAFFARRARAAAFGVMGLLACLNAPRVAHADGKSALPPTVDAFKMTKPVQSFSPGTLENHIDGQAESVKRYIFKQCDYAEYAPGGKGAQLITVDVYTMGSPLDSYGYYSYQLAPSADRVKFVRVGSVAGYQTRDSINFWKGPYYVVVTNTAASAPPSFAATMPRIAAAVAAKLNGAQSLPPTVTALVNALPPGRAAHSEMYQRTDVAAQTFLKNGVVARYPSAGPQASVFVTQYPSADAARVAYAQYQTYLTQPMRMAVGTKPQALAGVGSGGIAVRSKISGFYAAALSGKYVVGALRARDAASAQSLVKAAAAKAK